MTHPVKPQPGTGLPGLRHPWVDRLLSEHLPTLESLVEGLGSPLHLVFPTVFAANVQAFQEAFTQARVAGELLFAKKANKAGSFVTACAENHIGVDVASAAELEKALSGGIPGRYIGVSGPQKTAHLLSLSLAHNCLLAVDSLDELLQIQPLAQSRHAQARLLLRYRPDSQPHSRFGLNAKECEHALAFCRQHHDRLSLEGFSFHLSGYSPQERAQTASQLIDLCRASGLPTCRHVNLGGGFAVRYVAPEHWQTFIAQDSPAHYHGQKTFAGFYPYGSPRAGSQVLCDVLGSPVGNGQTLAEKAVAHGVALIIEPGRALLDQAGLSIFRVQGVKDRHSTDGYAHVTVQGSSFSLSEQWFNSEFLPEPLLLPASARPAAPFTACIGGATCLESDMLTWRKVRFGQPILPGDLLVYLNTAGYQMDSNESPFHAVDLPHKVAVELRNNHLHWKLDSLN